MAAICCDLYCEYCLRADGTGCINCGCTYNCQDLYCVRCIIGHLQIKRDIITLTMRPLRRMAVVCCLLHHHQSNDLAFNASLLNLSNHSTTLFADCSLAQPKISSIKETIPPANKYWATLTSILDGWVSTNCEPMGYARKDLEMIIGLTFDEDVFSPSPFVQWEGMVDFCIRTKPEEIR